MGGEYTSPGGPLRQSLARAFDECPQAAKWSAENPDFTTPPQALGSAFHLVAEEILRTLKVTGERALKGRGDEGGTEEALAIMREVLASDECPHLDVEQQADLRWMVLLFSRHEWSANRIVAIEERLFWDVPCPDGVVRTLTGTPDLLVLNPPAGVIIPDFKTGWAMPPAPRDGDWSKQGGRPYLSDRGTFQLDVNGFLVMKNYPAIEHATLREFHIRLDETREAVLRRDELEHVEHRIGLLLMRLDRTLTGELEPEARSGKHCSYCPKPQECPIPPDERGEGKITDDDVAAAVARRLPVVEAERSQAISGLKAYVGKQGNVDLGNGSYVGWRKDAKGKRTFGVHNRPDAEPA